MSPLHAYAKRYKHRFMHRLYVTDAFYAPIMQVSDHYGKSAGKRLAVMPLRAVFMGVWVFLYVCGKNRAANRLRKNWLNLLCIEHRTKTGVGA